MRQQPEIGIILEEIDNNNRVFVLSDCEYVSCHLKIKGVRLLNLNTGEIEIQRRSLDWWNWYFHPTGWDELR